MITGDSLSYSNTTTVHPLGLTVLGILVFYLFFTSREKALLPVLFLMVFIPSAQRLVVFSIDFSFIKIILIVALLRIFVRGEFRKVQINSIDIAVYLWISWSILAYGILTGEIAGLVARIGFSIDALGAYLVGRAYIQNCDHLKRVIGFLGIIAIPVAVLFLIERATGNNLFSVFGGVPSETLIRNDRLRCQGPYSHPIMAGIFWASILPWLAAFWFTQMLPKKKLILFTIATFIIILNTASSTPVMSVLFIGLALVLFQVRTLMPLIRLGGFFLLVFLHLVMENGVFHLISRIDIVGGSTGYHRYKLITSAIENFDEWWMVGTLSTAHWGRGMSDITNQYILEGVRGGFLTLVFFVLIIVLMFRSIGRQMRSAKTKQDLWLLWSIGTLIFMHVMNYLAVSYFGQLTGATYLFLGASVSLVMNSDRFQDNKINLKPSFNSMETRKGLS